MKIDILEDGPNAVPLSSCVTVVSVVVRDGTAGSRILLGVRKPSSTSGRHPGVLSTFTIRVPVGFFLAALGETGTSVRCIETGESIRFTDADQRQIGVPYGFANPSVFLVEALLARKLHLGDPLVAGTVRGDVVPLGLAADVVEDPNGGFEPERTVMLTYLVSLTAGRDLLPERTESFDPVSWVEGVDLRRAVERHDALILLPEANPFEVCLHGLCMTSAAQLLAF